MMDQSRDRPPVVLTIAGTDPSGGAGINVDLQVFRDFHSHGVAVITAVVWQNTQRIGGWSPVGPAELRGQLDLVAEDFDLAAVKIGMLPTAPQVGEVKRFVDQLDDGVCVVFDPVMAGGDGKMELTTRGGRHGFDQLVDGIDLITPNGPEALALVGDDRESSGDPEELVNALLERGWERVLLKGGHLGRREDGEVVDWLGDHSGVRGLPGWQPVKDDVRGTGCQLSSAIAALRAHGYGWEKSIHNARNYVRHLLVDKARRIGRGRPIIVRVDEE